MFEAPDVRLASTGLYIGSDYDPELIERVLIVIHNTTNIYQTHIYYQR